VKLRKPSRRTSAQKRRSFFGSPSRSSTRRLQIESLEARTLLAYLGGDLENVDRLLASVYESYQSSSQLADNAYDQPAQFSFSGDSVYVEVRGRGDFSTFVSSLSDQGMDIRATAPQAGLAEGYMPLSALEAIAKASQTISVLPVYSIQPTDSVGAATNAAETTLRADILRNLYGVDGTGVTVGVISDSANRVGGGLAD
jgi:hypothetical protein